MKLKDVYPLYLNNKAAQPNTDLEVTDKFTGEVAFRTALATPEIIDEAIAGAVKAAEPMARLASYEKRDVLLHCVARFRERFDELAYAEAYGASGHRAESSDHLRELLAMCRDAGGVHLIDCPVDYSQNDQILNKDIKELSKAL